MCARREVSAHLACKPSNALAVVEGDVYLFATASGLSL
jgi:hypothetical protein